MALILSLSVALVVRRSIQSPPSSTAGPMTILVSGDTQGLLFAGDCGFGLPGGLARRGTIVRQAQAESPVLYVELGNAVSGDSAYDRLKFAAIVRGEIAMEVAAHNIGPAEMRLGVEELQRLAAELNVPFVSTNIRDAHGRPLAEPMRLVDIAGRRIALAGIVSPSYAKEPLEVLDPAAAIEAALGDKAMPYDTLLVLAYLPADELSQLAARLPKRAVLVGPSLADSLDNDAQAGRASRVGQVRADAASFDADDNIAGFVGRTGFSLVRIDFSKRASDQWTSRNIPIDPSLPEDPRQLDNLVAYHQELARHDFAPSDTGLVMPLPVEVASTARTAGSHACRACHAAECASWDHSGHARAWQSLVNRGVHYDAACQRCHTTGYGWDGGFYSAERSIGTVSVGCESCHGPSLAHALSPSIRTPLVARQQCGLCHDADHSPGFDYSTAWLRIQHGAANKNKTDTGEFDIPLGLGVN
jgi:hypothetical protein